MFSDCMSQPRSACCKHTHKRRAYTVTHGDGHSLLVTLAADSITANYVTDTLQKQSTHYVINMFSRRNVRGNMQHNTSIFQVCMYKYMNHKL